VATGNRFSYIMARGVHKHIRSNKAPCRQATAARYPVAGVYVIESCLCRKTKIPDTPKVTITVLLEAVAFSKIVTLSKDRPTNLSFTKETLHASLPQRDFSTISACSSVRTSTASAKNEEWGLTRRQAGLDLPWR
jgi:hypothetical protein